MKSRVFSVSHVGVPRVAHIYRALLISDSAGSVTMTIESITTNPNQNPNHNLSTKQDAIANTQLNNYNHTSCTYQDKFVRDSAVAPFSLLSNVNVTLPILRTSARHQLKLPQTIDTGARMIARYAYIRKNAP